HRLGEVRPVLPVGPGGPHDVGAFRVQLHGQAFAFGFGATVGRYRVDARVFAVRGRGRAVEDVVGGQLHQPGAIFRRGLRQVGCSGGVDGVGVVFVGFGVIDLRVGGGVDDHVVAGGCAEHRFEVGHVEIGADRK